MRKIDYLYREANSTTVDFLPYRSNFFVFGISVSIISVKKMPTITENGKTINFVKAF